MTINLSGPWQFKAAGRSLPKKFTRWMNAAVPGTLHTDLLALGLIPDPFYRMNENDVQWIDRQRWVYRRTFTVPAGFLENDKIILSADGLDTFATITINGNRAGSSANMFIGHEFDVKRFLREGKNRITITFDSPTARADALEKQHGRLEVATEPHRVYTRKAQYSFGWDWGPKLTTSGIWQGISLRGFSKGRLRNPFVKITKLSRTEATVVVTADIEHLSRSPLSVRLDVTGRECLIGRRARVGRSRVSFTVRIPRPELWWPNGYGGQPMYGARLTLLSGDEAVDRVETPFALRTVKLVQKKDTEGKSFIIEVNGIKIFCKGADWIPCDNFLPRIPDTTYASLLKMAADAHMNMIRVWGGGIYERDVFYDLCDRLGLMVWQDFMYACGEYPGGRWFLDEARAEARSVVRRLRNHPSIVLWCGNNECEWLYCTQHPDRTPSEMTGSVIFRTILPSVCRELDGTRPYWQSSPFGSGFPNSESNGNHHQWEVWSQWQDASRYTQDDARFISEFGFQSPANLRTFEGVTLPADRTPQSPVMEHHNKQTEGTERLIRFQAGHFRITSDFETFIAQGQIVQAESLKTAVEHWRRRKFKTAGSLVWQINDCWPVSSWSVIDSKLRPKAAYYYAKRFFAPVLMSFRKTAGGIELWVTNDLLTGIRGSVRLSLHSFRRSNVRSRHLPIAIGANRSIRVAVVSPDLYDNADPSTHYLFADLRIGNATVSENRFFFRERKHLELPSRAPQCQLRGNGSDRYVLSIRSRTLLRDIHVSIDGDDVIFDDNHFDIDPGGVKFVRFHSDRTVRELRKCLKIKFAFAGIPM